MIINTENYRKYFFYLFPESVDPVASPKVGRVVKGGEWQRRFNGLAMRSGTVSSFVASVTTMCMCLTIIMVHL
jgi:hypothetical protein